MFATAGKAKKKEFPALLKHLHEMLEFVSENLKKQSFQEETLTKVEVAIEEALVNVISYSGLCAEDNILIQYESPAKKQGAQITIIDSGIPFNPLSGIQLFDLETLIGEEIRGGFGIFLICNIMDEVLYKRDGDRNVLKLIKYLE